MLCFSVPLQVLELKGLHNCHFACSVLEVQATPGAEFVEALASRGFAATLWLRELALTGFADDCSANISCSHLVEYS